MSQAPGPGSERIGGVHVDVTANVTPLKAGLKQAEAEAKAAAPKIAAAAGAGGAAGAAAAGTGGAGGLTSAGKQLRALTQPIRTFISGLTSITTIFLRMSGIIGLIVASLAGLVSILRSVQSAMSSVDGVTARATERITKLKEAAVDALVKEAAARKIPVTFTTEEFTMHGKAFKSLEDFRKKVHALRAQVDRDLKATGAAGLSDLLAYIERLEKAVFDPKGPPGAHDYFADALVNARELLKSYEQLSQQEAFLHRTDQAILDLRKQILGLANDEVSARLKLNRAQEQARFGAERMSADISRMVSLLEVIARQRRN